MDWWTDAPVPPADELVDAQRRAFDDIAGPGNWWSGPERVAIAAVVRDALALDEPPPPWAAPSQADGFAHPVLPATAVDAAHRIALHPGTLTHDWYGEQIGRGLTEGQYVELVTVVVRVASVDMFARAAGLAPPPLPGPRPGEPARRWHDVARVDRHWVPTIAPADAPADLDWLYPGRGAPNVIRALSAVPDQMAQLRPLQAAGYVGEGQLMDVTWDRGGLDRRQIELVAAKTSAVNECFY